MAPGGIDEAEFCDLFSRVRSGDREALDRLLAHHRGYLLSFVELRMDHRLRSRIDPSDVVQEAQCEAACRIAEYLDREPMPFHIWLRKTAFERLLRLRRQHVDADCRSVDREVPLPDSSSALLALKILSQEPDPGQQAVEKEMARRLRTAMASLPETDREILLMRNFEGLTNEEVAGVLDLDPAAASKRYGRAILRLRGLLLASDAS